MEGVISIINEINCDDHIKMDRDIYISGFEQKLKESDFVILCSKDNDILFLTEYLKNHHEKNVIQLEDVTDVNEEYRNETILIVGDEEYQWEQYKKSQEMMCDRAYIIDRTLKEIICTFVE